MYLKSVIPPNTTILVAKRKQTEVQLFIATVPQLTKKKNECNLFCVLLTKPKMASGLPKGNLPPTLGITVLNHGCHCGFS